MDGVMKELAPLDSSKLFVSIASLLLMFHVRLTVGAEKMLNFATLKKVITQLTIGQFSEKDDSRVEKEICKLQQRNYVLISRGVTHWVLPFLLYFLHAALQNPQLSSMCMSMMWFFLWILHWVINKEQIELTPGRMKIFCYSIHIFCLIFQILAATASPDVISFAAIQPFLATVRIGQLGFMDKSVKIPFDILSAAADVGIYIILFEVHNSTLIFFILLSAFSFTLTNICASCVLELWVRARIEASLETADAEALVSSFRRMLRGVSDGEVLLDNDFKICGESQCLQHLIMTTVSMAGKSFASLLLEEDRAPTDHNLPKEFSCGTSVVAFLLVILYDMSIYRMETTITFIDIHTFVYRHVQYCFYLLIHFYIFLLYKLTCTTQGDDSKRFGFLQDLQERQRFAEFIASSVDMSSESRKNFWPPVCLRMSFRGSAGIRVAADIYHVPVPGLHGSDEPFHLIAFKEDLELRQQPEAQEDAIPHHLSWNPNGESDAPRSLLWSRSKAMSSSDQSGSTFFVGVPELREMALLVDVNTEPQDIVKAHLRFRRSKHKESGLQKSQESMPSLQKIFISADFEELKSQVSEFADQAFWNPNFPPQEVKRTVTIRCPDERLVMAQRVYLKAFPGEESGSKVWLGLGSFSAIKDHARSNGSVGSVGPDHKESQVEGTEWTVQKKDGKSGSHMANQWTSHQSTNSTPGLQPPRWKPHGFGLPESVLPGAARESDWIYLAHVISMLSYMLSTLKKMLEKETEKFKENGGEQNRKRVWKFESPIVSKKLPLWVVINFGVFRSRTMRVAKSLPCASGGAHGTFFSAQMFRWPQKMQWFLKLQNSLNWQEQGRPPLFLRQLMLVSSWCEDPSAILRRCRSSNLSSDLRRSKATWYGQISVSDLQKPYSWFCNLPPARSFQATTCNFL